MENETNLNDWNTYIGGTFLKADHVEHDGQEFAIISVENYFDDRDESNKIRLHLESDGDQFMMDLNKTNANFLKNNGIATPKDLVGKVIIFKKVLARNPRTNQEVDSLRICEVK